jgi:hypothetical protein
VLFLLFVLTVFAGIMSVVLKEATVFVARKPSPTRHPREFAPMEHTRTDDELVYPVSAESRRAVQHHPPSISFTRCLAGRQSLFFECLVMHDCSCIALADSGATASFVSKSFLHRSGIAYDSIVSSARLADGSPLAVLGFVKNLPLKMGAMCWRQSFLVVDLPTYDMVWGTDFLRRFNPTSAWRQRTMSIDHRGHSHNFTAHTSESRIAASSPLFAI